MIDTASLGRKAGQLPLIFLAPLSFRVVSSPLNFIYTFMKTAQNKTKTKMNKSIGKGKVTLEPKRYDKAG